MLYIAILREMELHRNTFTIELLQNTCHFQQCDPCAAADIYNFSCSTQQSTYISSCYILHMDKIPGLPAISVYDQG
ncbi:hypothetical protein D3C81_1776550 [compost metagenome]